MFTEERALWLYQHYRWLDANLPNRKSIGRRTFILPTKEFFPHRFSNDHDSAVTLFGDVRTLMGMTAWPCRFEQRESREHAQQRDLARGGVMGESKANDPGGTFSATREKEVVITYSSHMLKDPFALVGTLAHELCHYLLATVRDEPPATWAQLEPLTDLAAVREGFGIFLCNAAFQFSQWTSHDQQGWRVQRKGYLTEAELGFGTAIFSVRNGLDPNVAARILKPNPREVFCDALDYIAELEARSA
jgi:hypothetical protein